MTTTTNRHLRLYTVPGAKPFTHDYITEYYGTVPFSQHDRRHFTVVQNPADADLVNLGQFDTDNCDDSSLYNAYGEYRLFAFIEGDYERQQVPDWLGKVFTCSSVGLSYMDNWSVVLRPPMSRLLVQLATNPPEYRPAKESAFYFQGLPDPHGVRSKVYRAISQLHVPAYVVLNQRWGGTAMLESPTVQHYQQRMQQCSFALCPAGAGQATSRFYEICSFGRVPILISDTKVMGEEFGYPTEFVYRLDPKSDISEMMKHFVDIWQMSLEEVEWRSYCSWKYFQDIIKIYFNNPTQYFVEHIGL